MRTTLVSADPIEDDHTLIAGGVVKNSPHSQPPWGSPVPQPQQQPWRLPQPQVRQPPLPPVKPKTGAWYVIITIFTAGFLACVPFFHAASVLKRRSLRKLGALYAGGALLGFTLINIAPEDATDAPTGPLSDIGAVIMIVVLVAGLIQQRGLRREVYMRPPVVPDDAVAMVEEARRKRQEARELATRDGQMARDLRIGRPDLPRRYDDGGLVDLNTAPADVIAWVCQIPAPSARAIVDARTQLGRFTSFDEAAVYASLGDDEVEAIKDKGLIIPVRSE